MTKRGALTEADDLILQHLFAAGPATTRELQEDLDNVGLAAYARLVRLHRLGLVDRLSTGPSRPVLWWVTPAGMAIARP